MSVLPVQSGALRFIAQDIREHGGQPRHDAVTIDNAADDLDRTRDALRELLKLFMEIDAGEHARDPVVTAARRALGLDGTTTGASHGNTTGEAARG